MFAKTDRAASYSLRRRLTTGMVAGFMVILTAISAGLWTYARNAANRTYDLLLTGSALAITERIVTTPEGPRIDIPSSALEIVGLAEEDRVFYRIFDGAGTTLTGKADLPLPELVGDADEPRFFDAAYSGETVRFILLGKLVVGLNRPQWVHVQLGQTRSARDALQFDLFSKGLAGLVVIAAIGLVFMRIGINRAMRPLAGIEADLSRREPTDLTPLRALPPREVEGLIGAINSFMRRLDTSREHAQTFIADVAHQMRTSLATLQSQLQLAADENNAALASARLDRAAEQATRTIHLTNQLLSHAMVIHRSDSAPTEPVRLLPLITAAVEEIMRNPATNDMEFAVESLSEQAGKATVVGDPIALREAIRNLLDNAVRHGPADNRIEVRIEAVADHGQAVRIAVEDAGPGIPEAERDKVLQRFYSLNDAGGGSGIGLSIVSAVAESHRGRLILSASRHGGLRATLDLPMERRR